MDYRDYLSRSWYVGHTWSLSVEEQFYLMWPLLFWLLSPKGAARAAGIFLLTAPVIRIGLYHIPAYKELVGESFETMGDSIAAGCILAYLRTWLWEQQLYRRLLSSPFFSVVPLVVLAAATWGNHPHLAFVLGFPIMNIGIALIIDWAVSFPTGRIGRVLNAPQMVFIGTLSYSLYLWQQLFLNRHSSAITASFPLNVALAAVVAYLFYRVIERPALQFRRQIEIRLLGGGEVTTRP